MPNLLELQQELNTKLADLDAFVKDIRDLADRISVTVGAGGNGNSNARKLCLEGQRATPALLMYMRSRGNPGISLPQAAEGLVSNGYRVKGRADAGKFPLRTAANAIHNGLKTRLFEERDGLFYVRQRKIT